MNKTEKEGLVMQPEEEKRSQMEILKKVLRYLMRYRFFILLSVFFGCLLRNPHVVPPDSGRPCD